MESGQQEKKPLLAMQALPANGSVSGLRVPDTAEVLKQIEEGGSSVTPRDVAMSIIERLQKNPANEYAEVAFLKEYVESPSFMKSIPLVLLTSLDSESGSGESTPDDFAISTMTGGTRGGVGPLSWVMDTQNMKRTGGRHVRKMKTWSEEGTRKVDFDLGPALASLSMTTLLLCPNIGRESLPPLPTKDQAHALSR